MEARKCLWLAALYFGVQAGALAQGRPGGERPAAQPASEHNHHGDAGAPPADARAPGARGAGREWTRLPVIVPVMRGGERERGTLAFAVRNSDAAALDVFAPEPEAMDAHRKVALAPDGAKIAMLPKLGNYYWLSAREEKDGKVSIASTVAYFTEPGPAPTRLLATPNNEIEIVPQPLPREHGNYRESEKWAFLLRFHGTPLAGQPVKMETEFGTKTSFTSDAQGVVTVLFPRDFRPAQREGDGGTHGGPRRAKFVLAAEHEAEGKQYLAAFNATYSPDADRDRSLGWGAAFSLLGMMAATPLLRRRSAGNGQGDRHA